MVPFFLWGRKDKYPCVCWGQLRRRGKHPMSSRNRKNPYLLAFLLQHPSPNTGSGYWLHVTYGPYSDRGVQEPLQRNSRWKEERERKMSQEG